MMRSRPKWLGVSLGLLLACCSPSGRGSSPVQRIVQTPQTGGQTGDPGVADYTSIVKIAQGGGSAACACPPQTLLTGGADTSGALALGGAKLLPLDGGRLVLVDPLFGLRVLDVRDPTAPVVEGQVALGGLPLDMHVLGTRVLVVQRFADYKGGRPELQARYGRNQLELVRIDVSDPAHPTLVDRIATDRGLAMSHLAQHAERAILYLVTDGALGATTIRSFDVSATRLAQLSELDIGSGTQPHGSTRAVRASEQVLAVASSDATVGLIDLSAPDGTMTESPRVAGPETPRLPGCATPPPPSMHLSNGTLRVQDQTQLFVYDAHDVSAPRQLARCDLPATPDMVEFLGDLTLVGATLVSTDAAGACKTRSTTYAYGRSVLHGSRVLGRGLSAVDLAMPAPIVELYDAATLAAGSQPPLASAPFDPDPITGRSPENLSVVEDSIQATAADGTAETNLIAMPRGGIESDGLGHDTAFEAARIFTFSDHTLTRRGELRPAANVLPLHANKLAAWSQAGLTLFDASSSDTPKALAQKSLAPAFANAIDFGGFIVRQHALPAQVTDRVSSTQLTVDTVASTDDPEAAPALGSFVVPALTRLVRTGDLLVSVSRTFGASGPIGTVDVFDLSDPSHPEHASTFSTASLGADCYYCELLRPSGPPGYAPCHCSSAPDLVAVPNGLIARLYGPESYPTVPPALVGFLAIDLRDPAHPQTTLIAHDGGRPANVFAVGSHLYFSYEIPVENSTLTSSVGQQVRYYYRQVDLSDLSAPVLGPPINLPGDLMAVDDQGRLYTGGLMLAGSSPVAAVHRLELANDQARIVASREVGNSTVHYLGLDGQGHLLAEVMGPKWVQNWVQGECGADWGGPATRLLVLDAESLGLVSEIEIDLGSMLRVHRDGRAVFEGSAGIFVLDLHDAQNPKLQAFHSLDLPAKPALLFDGRQIVVQASGGLRRIDAEETNL